MKNTLNNYMLIKWRRQWRSIKSIRKPKYKVLDETTNLIHIHIYLPWMKFINYCQIYNQ
jgi:hypothetical protein